MPIINRLYYVQHKRSNIAYHYPLENQVHACFSNLYKMHNECEFCVFLPYDRSNWMCCVYNSSSSNLCSVRQITNNSITLFALSSWLHLCALALSHHILWSNHIRVLSSNLQCVAIIIFVYVFHVHLITEKLHYVYRDTPHMHIYTRINTKHKHIWTQKLRISKRHHNIIYMCNARCIAESTLHDGDYMLGRRKPTSDLAFDG